MIPSSLHFSLLFLSIVSTQVLKNEGYPYSSFIPGPGCNSLEPPRQPTTHDEVVAIVKEAIARGVTVKAYGARHSSTDIICTEGIPVDMHAIQDMSLDPVTQIVTVGAGVTVGTLSDFLATNGRGLPIIPAFQNITVGGAIGTGAHGSSLKYTASLSDQTVEALVVDGRGNIRTIQSEEDLNSFRVHLGLLGIILQVKFRTVPIFKFRAHNYVVNDNILESRALEMVTSMDEVILFWFPSFQKVVVANYTRMGLDVPGNARTNGLIPPTTTSFAFFGKRILEFAQSIKSLQFLNLLQYISFLALFKTVPDVQPIYTEDNLLVKNPAVGYYYQMTSVSCINAGWVQCPWAHGKDGARALDNEMAIDIQDLPRFTQRLRDIISKSPAVFPFEGILIRFSGSSTSHMSLSYGRTTCHIEFYPLDRDNRYRDPKVGLAAYQAIMQSLLNEFSGRSHWGKSGAYYHAKEQLERKLSPETRNAFIMAMKSFDPNGLFLNNFGRRLLGESEKMDWDPLVVHCALLDNCLCSKDDDCATSQKCSRIDSYPSYPVCLSKGLEPKRTKLINLSWYTIYYD